MTGVLSTIEALRADVDTARAEAASIARDHAALTEHTDALEAALATVAAALGTTWEDNSVAEGTARLLASIVAMWRGERVRCAAECKATSRFLTRTHADGDWALACETAIWEMTDD